MRGNQRTMIEMGLAGVVAGRTAISTVGKEGVGLTYRGYSIEDLAENASFEEVAYLLLNGRTRTANLAATDVVARNGVIHVIDKVLLPSLAN